MARDTFVAVRILSVGLVGALALGATASADPARPAPKLVAVAKQAPKPPKEPALPNDLVALTKDPVLGKSSRVNGDERHGVVAFTFDDGPNPETTPTVIDALEKYDVPATFFIVTQRLLGKHGEKSRELITREVGEGFLVGSHSVTHAHLGKATGVLIEKEIDRSFRILAKEANRPIGLFRPPYGALSGSGRARLKQLGVTEAIWSIDTLDWRAHNADKLRAKVVKMILKDNGGVVLMHDVKPITAKVIAGVLDDLEAENCKRLAESKEPIVPVSIHYFLRDGKKLRDVPADAARRTQSYKDALPGRCAARPRASGQSDPPPASGSGSGSGAPK